MLYARLRALLQARRDLAVLPALAADRDRALHVLRRRDARSACARSSRASRCSASSRFPRLVIPTSRDADGRDHLRRQPVVVAVFIAWNGIAPQLDWLLLMPLLLELYVFILGDRADPRRRCSSGSATSAQVWELALQLLFYASPIIYPIGFLPPCAAQRSRSSTRSRRCSRTSARSCSTRTSPPNMITARDVVRQLVGAADPDRDRARRLRVRAVALPARGALVRGARLMRGAAAIEVDGRLEVVPAPARAADDVQGALPPPVPARRPTSTSVALEDVSFAVERGRVLRDHRPERQRQEHAAQDPRRHLPAGPRRRCASTACSRRSSSSASASTPS